ncbi:MAG TPA: hypothetical protein VGS62_09820 [Streptosporangiaceae bacterium]|nr:hypothetical protein [Streptosporangiaceae bacterium]
MGAEGIAVTWDGANADELKAVAGDRFEGLAALVRNDDGDLVPMLPGWVAAPWPDGSEGLGIFSPGAWEHWGGR